MEKQSKYFCKKWKTVHVWKHCGKYERERGQGIITVLRSSTLDLKTCKKQNNILLRDGTGLGNKRREKNFYYKSTVVLGLFIQEIQMKWETKLQNRKLLL